MLSHQSLCLSYSSGTHLLTPATGREKAMAPHSSTLAWKSPMDRGAWWAAVHGVARSQTWLSNFTFTFHFHALEKETAIQCSCLENPGDGGAWWAAVYGVAQSRTGLKRLSSSSSSVSQILSTLGSLLFNYNFLLEWWIVTFTIYTLFKQMVFNFIM